jgi:hypothetical protein
MPPLDGGRLNQQQRVSPPRPHPAQDQPQQTVRWAKASVRTRQYGQLVVQGKHLEQQVSTRRQRESDHSDRPDDVPHRGWHGQLPCQGQWFLPGRDIGEAQVIAAPILAGLHHEYRLEPLAA